MIFARLLQAIAVDLLATALGGHWTMTTEVLVFSFSLFLLPSLCLGAVSPVAARMALANTSRNGITVGTIYATGTATMSRRSRSWATRLEIHSRATIQQLPIPVILTPLLRLLVIGYLPILILGTSSSERACS